jgi:hypothetical protein
MPAFDGVLQFTLKQSSMSFLGPFNSHDMIGVILVFLDLTLSAILPWHPGSVVL